MKRKVRDKLNAEEFWEEKRSRDSLPDEGRKGE